MSHRGGELGECCRLVGDSNSDQCVLPVQASTEITKLFLGMMYDRTRVGVGANLSTSQLQDILKIIDHYRMLGLMHNLEVSASLDCQKVGRT